MIIIKTPHDQEKMRKAGRITGEMLDYVEEHIKPGVTTRDLDMAARRFLKKAGATGSFLNYGGFPAVLCISVNDEVVHGIPGDRVLREGDIVSVDAGAKYDGYHGDSARTIPVGEISDEAKQLIRVTEECFWKGLAFARPGFHISDISHAVQIHAESHGYGVVRELTGHGIGRSLHEDPAVPNFGPAGRYERIRPGMTICIEPMINMGTRLVNFNQEDGWTVTTRDGSLSAHYEHTVLITEGEPELLTLSPKQGRRDA